MPPPCAQCTLLLIPGEEHDVLCLFPCSGISAILLPGCEALPDCDRENQRTEREGRWCQHKRIFLGLGQALSLTVCYVLPLQSPHAYAFHLEVSWRSLLGVTISCFGQTRKLRHRLRTCPTQWLRGEQHPRAGRPRPSLFHTVHTDQGLRWTKLSRPPEVSPRKTWSWVHVTVARGLGI